MALKSNLRQRGTRFHFRRKLTSEIAVRFGRREIVCALKTSSARLAAIRAREIWLAIEEVIRQVNNQPTITKEQIDEMVRLAINSMAWADEVVLARDGRFLSIEGPAPKDAEADILENYAEEYRADLARNNIEPVRHMIEKYARKLGLDVAPDSVDERLIGRAMLKAVADSLDGSADRFRREILPYLPDTDADRMRQELEIIDELEELVGKPQPEPEPEDRVNSQPTQPRHEDFQIQVVERGLLHSQGTLHPMSLTLAEFPQATAMTFSQAWQAYSEDMTARQEASEGSLRHQYSSIKLWIQIEGDRPIGIYRKSDAAHFRLKVARLPDDYHRDKVYRNKSIDDIIELAEAREEKHQRKKREKGGDDEYIAPLVTRVKLKTINRHISALSSIFKWCVETGKLPQTYEGLFAKLIKHPKQSKYKLQEERLIWQRADVKKLFNSPLYKGCLSRSRRTKPGTLVIRDWKFWAPLIGAYTGMRREEVAIIRVGDVINEDGVCYFNLRRVAEVYDGEIKDRAGEIVMSFRQSMVKDLEGIGCLKGGKLIYSMWPGYLERSEPNLREWAERQGMTFEIIHTSGHADAHDLRCLVEAIDPGRLVPIHTLAPMRYRELGPELWNIRDGEWGEA
jgi:integrase